MQFPITKVELSIARPARDDCGLLGAEQLSMRAPVSTQDTLGPARVLKHHQRAQAPGRPAGLATPSRRPDPPERSFQPAALIKLRSLSLFSQTSGQLGRSWRPRALCSRLNDALVASATSAPMTSCLDLAEMVLAPLKGGNNSFKDFAPKLGQHEAVSSMALALSRSLWLLSRSLSLSLSPSLSP